jgi:hypothetical protein
MQHKSLLAAMMVGALVLASCVKNQESQSVTDVRNARADEIKSQAELNRANAEAAVTLAKAQAAIAAAQAELLKAQQAIVEAEAAKLQVEAELAAVEVEIAKVKLEGERVKLQAKKAELEALIAKYEADIAKYAANKQKAINELEKAEADAEINEIKSQIELLQQKKNLFDAIVALEGAKQEEIATLWASYESEVVALNRAQSNLISAQASLARLEAGEETAAEILVKQIQDKNAEIFSLKRYIEQLKDNVNISAAQLDVLINAAHAEYETALTEERQATEAKNFIQAQIDNMEGKTDPAVKYAYQEEWNDKYGPIYGFNSLDDIIMTKDGIKVFKKATKENPETGRKESGVYFYYPGTNVDEGDADAAISATFLPLFTTENKPEVLTEDVDWYVPQVDGVAGTGTDIYYQKVLPAKVYVDNFKTVLPIYKEIVEEVDASKREALQRQYDRIAARVEKILERDLIEINAHKEYIENASEDINNAIQAINVAKEGVFIAESKYDEAEAGYFYFLNNYDGSVATEIAEKNALFAYKESLAKFEKAEEAYEEARLAIFGTPVNDEATNEEAEPIIVEGLIAKVQRLEERAYLARKEAAEAWATLEPLQKAWEAVKGELEGKVTEAENKLKEGKEAVITAKVAAQEALEAYHWAVIVYTAATDPAKKAQAKIDMDEAEEAYKEAVKEVNTKQDAIAGLETALANAVAAQAEVEDPYLVAKAAFEPLDVFANDCYKDWQDAEKALGTRKTATTEATGAFRRLEIAEGIYDTAVTDLSGKYDELVEAQKANVDAPEELNKLRTEYNEAYEGIFAARKAVREARKDYVALIFGPDAKYPKYMLYLSEIDPDAASYFDEINAWTYKINDENVIERVEAKAPGQLAARYMWLQDTFGAFTEEFEEAIATDELSKLQALFENYEVALDRIHSEETAYLESMEVLQEAYDELNDAKIALADADLDVTLAEAAYKALAELKGKSMFVVTPGYMAPNPETDFKTIKDFEAYIKTMEEKLVELEKELADLEIKLAFGEENGRGRSREYTAARIAELEANIEMYETAIEYHTAQIEYYLEAIAGIMADPVE